MSASNQNWPQPHRFTVDQYYRMADVGLLSPDDRVELIEGEIVDMPPIGSRHAAVVTILAKRLCESVRDAALVRVQAPLRLGRRSQPQPDIALVRPKADSYKDGHPGADDVLLLIEVSESTLHFDLEDKSRLYARHRIGEYWVVDLIAGQLHCLRHSSGWRYAECRTLSAGAARFAPLDIEIHIDELF